MSFIGKLHEISFYGLISAVVTLICGKASVPSLYQAGFCVTNFSSFFLCYLFWASVTFLPIAIIGAFETKYVDYGVGLSFHSDNIVVIIFAHLGEEILGLVLTPFWFLRALFTHNLDGGWKIFDYISYLFELIFITIGFIAIF